MSNRRGRGNCRQDVNSGGGRGVAVSEVTAVVGRWFWRGIYGAEGYRDYFFFSGRKCHVACVDLFTMLADYVCACSLCLQLALYVYNLLTMSVACSLCL